MVQRYSINFPSELRELATLTKDGAVQKMLNAAQVWSAATRKGIPTPWDGRVGVCFLTKKGAAERTACVFRVDTNGAICELGKLRYNLALKWCMTHLKPMA